MADLMLCFADEQIEPSLRGQYALILEVESKGGTRLREFGLESTEYHQYMAGNNFPMRIYRGVNEKARKKLEIVLARGEARTAFDLDVQVVRPEVVKHQSSAIFEMRKAVIAAQDR